MHGMGRRPRLSLRGRYQRLSLSVPKDGRRMVGRARGQNRPGRDALLLRARLDQANGVVDGALRQARVPSGMRQIARQLVRADRANDVIGPARSRGPAPRWAGGIDTSEESPDAYSGGSAGGAPGSPERGPGA